MKKLNVVLYHPEIPQNTGNIMRSCVGFNAKLHLIKPLGFKLDEKHLQRSALDYFEYLDYEVYEDFDDFLSKNSGSFYFFTRYGNKTPNNAPFDKVKDNIYLFFGAESTGIAYDILKKYEDDLYRIPTTDKIRSLNLSNTVAIALYEASSKLNDSEIYNLEPESLKGPTFIQDVDVNTLDYKHKEWNK